MGFKYTSVVLLLCMVSLLAQAKHIKKDKSKQNDSFTKRYEKVKYRGEWKDCDDYHIKTPGGGWCNCPFVACTGSQTCTAGDFYCRFMHSNVDVENMTREDCACEFLK